MKTHLTSKRSCYLTLAIGMIVFCVCAGCSSVIVLPGLERRTCISRVAQRIGVEASSQAINEYIRRSLPLGISQTDAITSLEHIGRVTVGDNTVMVNGKTRLTIVVGICYFPFNDIGLYAIFSPDDKLEAVVFIDDSP